MAQRQKTPPVVRIAIGDIGYGHTPDKRPQNRGLLEREGPPIDICRQSWGKPYRIIDGNDRLYYGRMAGRRSINARIWA